jgi:hypothetical protein
VKALAGFFNHFINGEVPGHFQTFLRQTYLVALEKDPEDKTKLLPLGVPSAPSAIRRIAANIVLKVYSPIFADHLLPFNYAIGVSDGGVDIIVLAGNVGDMSQRNVTLPTFWPKFSLLLGLRRHLGDA